MIDIIVDDKTMDLLNKIADCSVEIVERVQVTPECLLVKRHLFDQSFAVCLGEDENEFSFMCLDDLDEPGEAVTHIFTQSERELENQIGWETLQLIRDTADNMLGYHTSKPYVRHAFDMNGT